MRLTRFLTAIALVFLIDTASASPRTFDPAPASGPCWSTLWSAAMQRPVDPALYPGSTLAVHDMTLRQVVRSSAAARDVTVTISNEYGDKPLRIARAGIGRVGADVDRLSSSMALRFDGRPDVVVPAGKVVRSDPVVLGVAAGQRLAVSLYLPDNVGAPTTVHLMGNQVLQAANGDDVDGTALPAIPATTARFYLARIDGCNGHPRDTIVTLGDSITDGTNSTLGADRRYPDALARRLVAAGLRIGVANMGIDGNRLLHGHWGDAGLTRLDRDVLALPNVRWAIVLFGINDIYAPNYLLRPDEEVNAAALIEGYRALIARLHARKIRVALATLSPNAGAEQNYKGYHTDRGETIRQAVNRWIREQSGADLVLDIDKTLRDPLASDRLRRDFDSGDHLHPNDRGYAAMAQAVPLSFFRR